MDTPRFVAGDWGTSHLRLYLCDAAGTALETIEGPGVAVVRENFGTVLGALLAPWESRHGRLPTVLCGMVGSTIGWTPVPYIDCPALPETIFGSCVPTGDGRVRIVPGLRCRNRLGAPDFIRGEETQVLGATRLDPALARGSHLLCLPGTHTKWVVLREGRVAEFLTAPTGELFSLLREHSVLLRGTDSAGTATAGAAFEAGLQRIRAQPRAQLLHLLFECRGRLLAGTPGAADAGFLSGLLVGADVAGALDLFDDIFAGGAARTVTLVGAAQPGRAYATALAGAAVAVRKLDGAEAARAGLAAVHAHGERASHAA